MATEVPWKFYTKPEVVNVHGLDVAYRRKGSGEPVLFLHGAGLTRRWLPFYEAMSQFVDVIVPEHPGFGDTPFPEWLDGFEDLVLHYAEFLDALGLEKVHLVGHSLGGWIAAEFATFYPERLLSFQLIAPAGLKGAELHDPFRQSGDEALARVFNGHAQEFPDYLDEGEDATEAMIHDYQELTARARLQWQPRHNRKFPRRLERVTAPTQVILPQDDRVLDSKVSAQYAEYIPGATVATIESNPIPTSHVPFVQTPDGLATMVTDFVAKNKES